MGYYLDCRDVGVDCEFRTYGETIEEVIEHCADHGRHLQGMTSFSPDFFAKMRRCVVFVDASSNAPEARVSDSQ
jgi:predicted small metal-binding protein